MRKSIIALCILACTGLAAHAQGASEALLFGENTYYGTARSLALGNAMTALGGDLGSIGINPAGSAVNRWSQFTFTPALSVFSGSSTFNDQNPSRATRPRMNFPNIGTVITLDMHSTSGLKNVSFGFAVNTTDIYNSEVTATGLNSDNAYMAYLADYATRYNIAANDLNDNNLSNLKYYTDWPAALAYQTGVVNPATGVNGAPYISPVQANAGDYPMRGPITQEFGLTEKGSKQDVIMNFAMNFSDRFIIGGNLGLVMLSYNRQTSLKEIARNSGDFPVTLPDASAGEFEDMTYRYGYSVSGAGVYAKLGFIAVPFEGLRLGASVQTRTSTTINEYRWYSASSNFTDGSKSHSHGGDRKSPDYEYRYDFKMPARYNFGIAYTIPGIGLLSADYEISDFGNAKYLDRFYDDPTIFNESNKEIDDYLGIAQYVRAGLEVKIASLALRAGYNLAITPVISSSVFDGTIIGSDNKLMTHSVAGGIGYDSGGSFFMDLALKARLSPDKYRYLYPTNTAPEITTISRFWNALVTFGFRF